MDEHKSLVGTLFKEALECWIPIFSNDNKKANKVEAQHLIIVDRLVWCCKTFGNIAPGVPNSDSVKVCFWIADSAQLYINRGIDDSIGLLKETALIAKSIDINIYNIILFLIKTVQELKIDETT